MRLPAATEVRFEGEGSDAGGNFREVVFRRYEHERTYSTQVYLDLLLSYSGHRAMESAAQRGLLSYIARLIDKRYDGQVLSAT